MIQRILHIPQCMTSGLTFRGKRDGGVDFPKLKEEDKEAVHRARTETDLECRKFRVKLETHGHILGQCTYTKEQKNIIYRLHPVV